ncbi:rRNA-processing protein EBP2-like [Camellia sinensis]|uniref:rRNA-processing protein EBP2-like n=1 Tax=Camellia sinensis TaxID=4442 RepID=UPI001035E94E|nr:rRNA-processing protein EBP2-like [Camellia sinensis]
MQISSDASVIKNPAVALSLVTSVLLPADKATFRAEPDLVAIGLAAQSALLAVGRIADMGRRYHDAVELIGHLQAEVEGQRSRAQTEGAHAEAKMERASHAEELRSVAEKRANASDDALKLAQEAISKLEAGFCEHTLIIHLEVSKACPRVIKWNLIKLHKRMKVISLHQLTTRQVTIAQFSEESDEELDNTEEEEKEDAENTEDEEQEDAEEEKQKESDEELDDTEEEEKEDAENAEDEEQENVEEEEQEKEVHETSEVVDKELYQKEVHENSEVVNKELHQKEVHEITQQPFATKHCETNTNVKDCQNSQLQNQLLEEEVHDLTQQVCAIKADDLTESRQTNLQNSMIKNIKAKARKTTEVSDYEYRGKKVRVEKEKEHKDETISNNACIWFGARYENCVFINDIKNLVKGIDISSYTIDAYAEILQREPQAQNSGDGAEHNGKSFILSSLYWDTPCQAEKAWNPDVKIELVKDSPQQ